jgi:hypothetical protein
VKQLEVFKKDGHESEVGRNGEVLYMERPIEPNMGPSLADVLL